MLTIALDPVEVAALGQVCRLFPDTFATISAKLKAAVAALPVAPAGRRRPIPPALLADRLESLGLPLPKVYPIPGYCLILDCKEVTDCRGLCIAHHRRLDYLVRGVRKISWKELEALGLSLAPRRGKTCGPALRINEAYVGGGAQ